MRKIRFSAGTGWVAHGALVLPSPLSTKGRRQVQQVRVLVVNVHHRSNIGERRGVGGGGAVGGQGDEDPESERRFSSP